jgi:preprotein translocase subunit YajC
MGFFISDAYAAAPAQDPGMAGLIFPLAIICVFYMLFVRPQQKKAKEHKNLVSALNRGAVRTVTFRSNAMRSRP